jgi:hypothetical protein
MKDKIIKLLDDWKVNKHKQELMADELLILFGVSIAEGQLCEICEENEAKVIAKHCYSCDQYIINGEHN